VWQMVGLSINCMLELGAVVPASTTMLPVLDGVLPAARTKLYEAIPAHESANVSRSTLPVALAKPVLHRRRSALASERLRSRQRRFAPLIAWGLRRPQTCCIAREFVCGKRRDTPKLAASAAHGLKAADARGRAGHAYVPRATLRR
jgi:hypothetical protein